MATRTGAGESGGELPQQCGWQRIDGEAWREAVGYDQRYLRPSPILFVFIPEYFRM